MKTLYQYAIVRFFPFAETGEFANIGIVLCAPAGSIFAFQLVHEHAVRAPQFFPRINEALFPLTIRALTEELNKVQQLAEQQNAPKLFAAFQQLTQPSEELICYSSLRSVLTVAKPDELLAQLVSQLVP
jgi:hypothetical protein